VGLLGSWLPALGREHFVHAQDFHPRRSEQDLAEVLHQAGNVLARVAAAVAYPLELVEAAQFDLELQRGPALAA
jgi:hypothetical protein